MECGGENPPLPGRVAFSKAEQDLTLIAGSLFVTFRQSSSSIASSTLLLRHRSGKSNGAREPQAPGLFKAATSPSRSWKASRVSDMTMFVYLSDFPAYPAHIALPDPPGCASQAHRLQQPVSIQLRVTDPHDMKPPSAKPTAASRCPDDPMATQD